MVGRKESVIQENKAFYERLYRKKSSFAYLLHMTVSYDQQSKAKLNKKYLSPYFDHFVEVRPNTSPTLLDYGSGWGTFLKKTPRNFKLYCFDLSEHAMQRTCSSLGRLGLNVSPATIDEGSLIEPTELDFIVCSHVLEHVEDDRKILDMFYRGLSEKGVLLINIPINEVWDDPKHLRSYTRDSVDMLLHKAGFEIIEMIEADKWTGFFLEREFLSGATTSVSRLAYRACKLILAVLPLGLLKFSERLFMSNRKHQQLIVVAKKADSIETSQNHLLLSG